MSKILRIKQKFFISKIMSTIMSIIIRKKRKSNQILSPKQQKMLDMFRVIFICGILGLIITLLIVILADIDPNGVTFFV
jgi:Na+/H+-translocating membrane pyrophosphatase